MSATVDPATQTVPHSWRRTAAWACFGVALASFVVGGAVLAHGDFADWLAIVVAAPPIVVVSTAIVIRRDRIRHYFALVAGTALLLSCLMFITFGGIFFIPGVLLVILGGAICPRSGT
ncbi:MAG: hypothetical protein WAO61_05015 [Solirubrobacterales bacterium]